MGQSVIDIKLTLVYIVGAIRRHQMTRLTVTPDEKVVDEARDLLKAKTKRETIETALKEVIKQKKREKDLKHCGEIELDIDQKGLQAYRESG